MENRDWKQRGGRRQNARDEEVTDTQDRIEEEKKTEEEDRKRKRRIQP